MRCPKCGGTAKYKVSRKKFWKDQKSGKGTKPREDFTAKCLKCKFTFNALDYYDAKSEIKEKPSEKKFQIKMKYTEKKR